MQFQIENRPISLEKEPDHCPLCHHAVQPPSVAQVPVGLIKDDNFRVEAVFRCPRQVCGAVFVARCIPVWPERPSHLTIEQLRQQTSPVKIKIDRILPVELKEPELYQEIIDISPAFQTIYSQASIAEGLGLAEIAGVGFRKALEFLIKDFAISESPDKETKIKATPLGSCIDEFVDDANLKACAKRAVWLGNDETHYVRRWDGKDLSDLKTLVQLTIGWVRNSVLTKKYLAEMPDS